MTAEPDLATASTAPAVAPHPGAPPRHGPRLALVSVVIGLLITSVWSAPFVDRVIGGSIAGAVLGQDPEAGVATSFGGLILAFAAGLAGTFTACNVAVFSALAPMSAASSTARGRLGAALRPLGWISVGALPLVAVYGGAAVLFGDRLPQLSSATVGNGLPVRLIQSMVVYGVVGIVFAVMGLAALRLIPDPLARLTARYPRTPLVVIGLLVGLFLVGRPFPLFRTMFTYAVATANPFYGALACILVTIGNIVVMGVAFCVLAFVGGDRLQRWANSGTGRVAAITGSALLVAGVFTIAYWDIRLLSLFGYGWFPVMPWV